MMIRKYRDRDWNMGATHAMLRYALYQCEVTYPTPLHISWKIYDISCIPFGDEPTLVASGIATSVARACFMCETWLQGKTK